MSGDPATSCRSWTARGIRHIYVDGGITIQRFLQAGLIQRLIITRVPVLIGAGIPLFGALPHDITLTHVATRHYASGLVQSEYVILEVIDGERSDTAAASVCARGARAGRVGREDARRPADDD